MCCPPRYVRPVNCPPVLAESVVCAMVRVAPPVDGVSQASQMLVLLTSHVWGARIRAPQIAADETTDEIVCRRPTRMRRQISASLSSCASMQILCRCLSVHTHHLAAVRARLLRAHDWPAHASVCCRVHRRGAEHFHFISANFRHSNCASKSVTQLNFSEIF